MIALGVLPFVFLGASLWPSILQFDVVSLF